MSTTTPCISVVDVSKRLGRNLALDHFSLELAHGEALALLGPNGAGKTTAVSLVLGLRRPDAGVVSVLGRDPTSTANGAPLIGSSPQEVAFPTTIRVDELIAFVASHSSQPAPLEHVLAACGLEPLARRQAGGLSGGERRRLSLALAICGKPSVLVLDEPTTGLDAQARQAMWHLPTTYTAAGGSLLLTTHDLHEVQSLADTVAVMNRGAVVLHDTPAAICQNFGGVTVRFDTTGNEEAVRGLAEFGRVTFRPSSAESAAEVLIAAADSDRLVAALVSLRIPYSGLRITEMDLQQSLDARAEHESSVNR